MTIKLKKAFSQLEKLPKSEQEAIADLLFEELAWRKSFENSQTQLERLAEEALQEFREGKTKPLDFL